MAYLDMHLIFKLSSKNALNWYIVRAESELSPSRIEIIICSDCPRTVLGLSSDCSDSARTPRTVLGLLGLSSESTRTTWGRVKYLGNNTGAGKPTVFWSQVTRVRVRSAILQPVAIPYPFERCHGCSRFFK